MPEEKKFNGRRLRPGIAPSVRLGLELPRPIDDWHLMGRRWFQKGLIGFFADLPTQPWEEYRDFIGGAIRVLCELKQTSIFPAFVPSKSKSEVVPRVLAPYSHYQLTRGHLGQIKIEGWVSLDATPDEVGNAIVAFIKPKLRRRPGRPVKFENLKRDFVVYVLDREGWNMESIEAQLRYMGCGELPNKEFQKVLVRRIRARFQELEQRIADSSQDYQATSPSD